MRVAREGGWLMTQSPPSSAGRAVARTDRGRRSSYSRVVEAATARGLRSRGGSREHEHWFSCPVHDERTPSLHVSWREGRQGGYVLLHCFGCHAPGEDLAAALGLRLADLFDEPLPERDQAWERGRSSARRKAAERRGHRGRLPALLPTAEPDQEPEHQWELVTRYPYADRQGTVVQYVVREECSAEGDRHKRFRQEYVGARGNVVKRRPEGFFPVLYRAPEVAAAIAAGESVWLLEGEKDADAAAVRGLAGTTNAMGATSFPDELVPDLEDADLALVLDRDEAGYARGVDLLRRLGPGARRIRVFLPKPTHEKADFTDHVNAGLGVEDLIPIEAAEVRIWHDLRLVRMAAGRVRQAMEQADAHTRLGASPKSALFVSAAEHSRLARRWAVEGQARFEALREQAHAIRSAVLQVGTEMAALALSVADDFLETSRAALRACHDRVGEAIPAMLRDPRGDVTVPLEVAEPAVVGSPLTRSAGRVRSHRFRLWNGAIVEWKIGRPEPEEEGYEASEDNYKMILELAVRVVAREFEDAEDESLPIDEIPTLGRAVAAGVRVREHRQLVAVRIRYPDPVTGEEMERRIPVDSWRDHSWLEGLPGGIDYDHRRSGKEVVERAVLAVSAGMVDQTAKRSTGWHEQPDGGWGYVHSRGVITAQGHRDEQVALDPGLDLYDLPDPVSDPQLLRGYFLGHSATLMERLPERVAAPVLGHAYRSVIGNHTCTVALVGQKATYKTSIAAKVMNHFGEAWGPKRYGSSMSGQGDTDNVVRMKLHHAKDTLYFMDDFAPTDNWGKAQRAMEDIARMVWNQQGRSRLERNAKSFKPGQRPRAAALMTSEVMPRPGSGADRLLPVPLTAGDVDRDQLFPLDHGDSRHARAALTASFLSWLARDYLSQRSRYGAVANNYAEQLSGEGFTDRESDVLGQMWSGWVAILDFLLDVAAISSSEREQMLGRVDEGLHAALAATDDPDQPRTAGGRVVELLRHALTQGLAHVDDHRNGDCPPWPLAGRLGWRRTLLDDGPQFGGKYRLDRLGIRAGYVCAEPESRDRGRVLMLETTALESILKVANNSQTDQLLIDRRTAQVALADLGVLITEKTRSGTVRYSLPCRIPVEKTDRRFVVLRLDDILPPDAGDADPPQAEDQEPPDGDGGDQGTAPPMKPGADSPAADDSQSGSGSPAPPASPGQKGEDVGKNFVFEPRPYTDRAGVQGWSELTPAAAPPTPCVICGVRCGMTISGVRIHTPCWEASTSADRAGQPAALTVSPATAESPGAGEVPHPEPQAPVPAWASTSSVTARRGRTEPDTTHGGAVVIDCDGVWTSTGEHLPLPAGGITSIAQLLNLGRHLQLGVRVRDGYVVDGQIWLGNTLAAQLGIDVDAITTAPTTQRDRLIHDATRAVPAVVEARAHGVFLGPRDGDSLGRWTRLSREGDANGIRLGIIAAMNPAQGEPRLLTGDPTSAQLARRIGLFTTALGFPFRHSAASTGLDLMMALRSPQDRHRIFEVLDPVPPAMMIVEEDLDWSRPPTAEEAQQQWCHGYDRGGSYLGGIAGLKLGLGAPVHHPEGTRFVKELPGYWRVPIPDQPSDWRHPALMDYTGARHGRTRWVSTPTLQLAIENDVDVEILEAYTWPTNSRVLDSWYARMRDARQHLDIPDDGDALTAREQVKEVYTKTIGMLGSHTFMKGKPGYRPDWRHLIQGKSNANLLRRVIGIGKATGRWPVAIKKDTLVYTSDDPNPVTAWPGGQDTYGRGLGKYKAEGSCPLADQLPFLAGGHYQGRDVLIGRAGQGVE